MNFILCDYKNGQCFNILTNLTHTNQCTSSYKDVLIF